MTNTTATSQPTVRGGPAITLGEGVAPWQSKLAAHTPVGVDGAAHADAMMATADVAEMAAIRARQAANRHTTYERRRPTRYADATYAKLTPEQNPRGMVASWWPRGPRALVVAGPARTGKTTAAYAIANHVHSQLGWVIAWTAGDLSAALKPDGDEFAYEYAAACDLLIIDDLGRERTTEWWLEQLQRLVDARCANQRRIVITTNATADVGKAYEELVARYGDPIVERLIDEGGIVVLDGPALRKVVTEW
jgi:DNA replication protein DnaC